MNGFVSRGLAVGVLTIAAMSCSCPAQSNTGGGGCCGAPDPNYSLVSAPGGVPLTARSATPPHAGWVIPSASNWINPWGNPFTSGPAGTYDYRTTFNLSTSAAVVGRMAGDNGVCLKANGGANIQCSTPVCCGFSNYTYFAIPASALNTGSNTLDFNVTNLLLSGGPSPTGLDVEFLGCPLGGAIYTDGPPNGTVEAWYIDFGFEVADSFTVNGTTPISGFCFYFWVPSGATPLDVEASVTSSAFGGTTYFDQTINLTCSVFCHSGDHLFGGVCGTTTVSYDVLTCSSQIAPFLLNAGTYWLNLQNATTNTGDPVAWDEAHGGGCPGSSCLSSADQTLTGTIPPESFVIY